VVMAPGFVCRIWYQRLLIGGSVLLWIVVIGMGGLAYRFAGPALPRARRVLFEGCAAHVGDVCALTALGVAPTQIVTLLTAPMTWCSLKGPRLVRFPVAQGLHDRSPWLSPPPHASSQFGFALPSSSPWRWRCSG